MIKYIEWGEQGGKARGELQIKKQIKREGNYGGAGSGWGDIQDYRVHHTAKSHRNTCEAQREEGGGGWK